MTAGLTLRVVDQRLLQGCSAGLAEPTAVLTVSVTGALDADGLSRIRAGALRLLPEQPLFGVGESGWPGAFLVEGHHPDASPLWRLGEWLIALTVALQRWARDAVRHGRVLEATPDAVRLAIPWQRTGVLSDTAQLAIRLVELWTRPSDQVPDVNAAIREGMRAAQRGGLQAGSLRYALAALERGIPIEIRPGHIAYGWGAEARRMKDSFTGCTSFIATVVAQNKLWAASNLAAARLPVPAGVQVADADEAIRAAESLGWPVVVKPVDHDQGRGVTAGLGDRAALLRAFDAAAQFSPGRVLVEKHVDGEDHRLLVVRGRLLAATRRTPAGITGDGIRTVGQLVEDVNADPRRGEDFYSLLKTLTLDAEAMELLAARGLGVDSVPPADSWNPLRHNANVSTGGTATDVTDIVHPDNRRLAVRAVRLLGLDIGGVDFLTTDIGRSWREVGGAICEVNAQPGTRVHWLAEPDRDINGEIIDILFEGSDGRIPTAAVTGTDHAASAASVLQQIWAAAGKLAGSATSRSLTIGPETARDSDFSGRWGAWILLDDPAVQAAVFEMPAAGLAESGHPCDRYDVVAVLGVDPLFPEGAAELVERAKAVVVDADDPACLAVLSAADGRGAERHVMVSCGAPPAALLAHRDRGGRGVFVEEREGRRWLVLAGAGTDVALIAVDDLGATDPRSAAYGVALAAAHGIDPDTIRAGLRAPASV